MAFLNALAGALRSRSLIQATGAASPSMETTSATDHRRAGEQYPHDGRRAGTQQT
jgi:hypothetical protein